jgi:CPA2 family monovalent cation:H+ antiporter-2
LVATVLNLAGLALVYAAAVRIVPWFLGHVARLQSRELFTLAVLAAAVGVAYGSAQAFGVSLALGAFLGGLVVGHSDLSHQAAADALPLRDAFAVLFFVSVGMLFDPAYLLAHPGLVLLTVVIVLLAKPLAAVVIVVALRYPLRTALTVSAGLAQIGEFSFIVGGLGRTLDLLPPDALHAILAAAFLTIALNPLLFRLVAPAETLLRRWSWLARHAAGAAAAGVAHDQDEPRRGHVVLCGHGRVGSLLARVLYERGTQLLVIEQDRSTVQALAGGQVAALHGDASNPYVLALAQLPTARLLLITLPDPIATRQIVDQARLLNPRLPVVARVHATGERQHLERQQGVEAVLGELELSLEMARLALQKLGVSAIEAQAVALDHRRRSGQSTEPSGARVLEAQVRAGSPAEGKSLTELGLGRGALVMAISRAGEFLVPDGQTRLAGGDTLLVIADREGLPRVRELLGR